LVISHGELLFRGFMLTVFHSPPIQALRGLHGRDIEDMPEARGTIARGVFDNGQARPCTRPAFSFRGPRVDEQASRIEPVGLAGRGHDEQACRCPSAGPRSRKLPRLTDKRRLLQPFTATDMPGNRVLLYIETRRFTGANSGSNTVHNPAETKSPAISSAISAA